MSPFASLLPGRVLAMASLGVASLSLVQCREPTQILLEIRTNLPCESSESWHGVAVYAGSPAADERKQDPILVTHECGPSGEIGSLVIVPSGAKDELVGVRVVAAASAEADVSPEQCAERDYRGCIVGRRALRFAPHDTLRLEVELTEDCISRGCDPLHTCALGSCVDSEEPEPVVDTSSSGNDVRCGDTGVRCATTGRVCCLDVDLDAESSQGTCLLPEDCPAGKIVLNCDDDKDCAALDNELGRAMCLLSYEPQLDDIFHPAAISSSQCLAPPFQFERTSYGLALCQDRQPCRGGVMCVASGSELAQPNTTDYFWLPGYSWCEVNNQQPSQ